MGREVDGGGGHGFTMYRMAFKHMASWFTSMYSWPLGVNYNKNDQPIRERVTASLLINSPGGQ